MEARGFISILANRAIADFSKPKMANVINIYVVSLRRFLYVVLLRYQFHSRLFLQNKSGNRQKNYKKC